MSKRLCSLSTKSELDILGTVHAGNGSKWTCSPNSSFSLWIKAVTATTGLNYTVVHFAY